MSGVTMEEIIDAVIDGSIGFGRELDRPAAKPD